MSAKSAQRTTASRGDRDGQDDAAGRSCLAIGVVGSGALAQNLRISTGLPDNHYWVAQHMNTLINTIKEATGGAVTFTTFYDGKLIAAGCELDALNKGFIDVAAPLLAPYGEGRFPLSDVTQLPTFGTDSPMVTRAFQKLLDSEVKLAGGKTFYANGTMETIGAPESASVPSAATRCACNSKRVALVGRGVMGHAIDCLIWDRSRKAHLN